MLAAPDRPILVFEHAEKRRPFDQVISPARRADVVSDISGGGLAAIYAAMVAPPCNEFVLASQPRLTRVVPGSPPRCVWIGDEQCPPLFRRRGPCRDPSRGRLGWPDRALGHATPVVRPADSLQP